MPFLYPLKITAQAADAVGSISERAYSTAGATPVPAAGRQFGLHCVVEPAQFLKCERGKIEIGEGHQLATPFARPLNAAA